jgi:hypothetical protein
VTAPAGSALALIVDHDLGFVMWLGEIFTELGCEAVPALHCRQALALTKRFNLPVAILVVNPELRGAERMIKELVAAHSAVRLVLIRNAAAAAPPSGAAGSGLQAVPSVIQARFTLDRPSPGETISRPEWVAKVRRLLSLASGERS